MFAAEKGLKGDPRRQPISPAIRVVPDFPRPGLMFRDITTLLLDHKAFKDTVDIFVARYRDMDISVVSGLEARGFTFGPAIALAMATKFVPLCKPRKLPAIVCYGFTDYSLSPTLGTTTSSAVSISVTFEGL
ncbi:adenine phosphoribosyltransferase 5-like [Eucalyptus grandis]|uniref:adenine phosphoribosyltransferase 5-like n=1 Tax=Eucalyptus grandis TaxID=71139 RepID=UPI00192F0960|nr:adenine phosphoribosyltransferase 5-like [Eucalyptus grandis]